MLPKGQVTEERPFFFFFSVITRVLAFLVRHTHSSRILLKNSSHSPKRTTSVHFQLSFRITFNVVQAI